MSDIKICDNCQVQLLLSGGEDMPEFETAPGELSQAQPGSMLAYGHYGKLVPVGAQLPAGATPQVWVAWRGNLDLCRPCVYGLILETAKRIKTWGRDYKPWKNKGPRQD